MRFAAAVLALATGILPLGALAEPAPDTGAWPRSILLQLADRGFAPRLLDRLAGAKGPVQSVTRLGQNAQEVAAGYRLSPPQGQTGAVRFRTGQSYRVLSDPGNGTRFVMGSTLTDTETSPDVGPDQLDRIRAGMHFDDDTTSGFYGLSFGREDDSGLPTEGIRGLLQLEFRF